MSGIIEISKDIDKKKQEKAENLHREILVRTIITASHLIELGKLFKQVRDEKLYKLLGASSFKEYCGYPEIAYARTTIYSFIGIYELFVLRFGYEPDYLSKIGHRKLQIITPIMKEIILRNRHNILDKGWEDRTFWLDNAEVLSESDLINAVRGFQGKKEMLPLPRQNGGKNGEINEKYYKFNRTGWVAFVTQSPCILHPDKKSENAHFPRTRKRGGEYWEIIPLCHGCHDEAHRDTFDFLWLNRYKIFKFFYSLLIGDKE